MFELDRTVEALAARIIPPSQPLPTLETPSEVLHPATYARMLLEETGLSVGFPRVVSAQTMPGARRINLENVRASLAGLTGDFILTVIHDQIRDKGL
jgi:hypothetical protein